MVAPRLQMEHKLKRYTTTGLTEEDLQKFQLTVGVLLDLVAEACHLWYDQILGKQYSCSTNIASSK